MDAEHVESCVCKDTHHETHYRSHKGTECNQMRLKTKIFESQDTGDSQISGVMNFKVAIGHIEHPKKSSVFSD